MTDYTKPIAESNTFIVLDRALPGDTTDPHQARMAGDVNLFFNEPDDKSVAEIEVSGIGTLRNPVVAED